MRVDTVQVNIADTLKLLRALRNMRYSIVRYKAPNGEKRNTFLAMQYGRRQRLILVDVYNQIEPVQFLMWNNPPRRGPVFNKIDFLSDWAAD